MASSSQRIPMAQSVDQSFQHVSLSCASDPLPPISSTPGNLVAVWATVSDFVGVSIKERTWWHLRHLQQSLMPGSARSKGQEGDADEDAGESISDGGMIRLAHCVVGKWSSHAHRKAKRGSIMAGTTSCSFSSSSHYLSSPDSPALSQLTKALASSAGASSVSRGGSPTVTTLDIETSPSTVTHNVNEDDLRTMVLVPSTQVWFWLGSKSASECGGNPRNGPLNSRTQMRPHTPHQRFSSSMRCSALFFVYKSPDRCFAFRAV
jgi:hypothetical protein